MAMRLCIGAVYSHAGLRWEPVYYDRIWTPTGFCDVIVQNVEVQIFVWEDNVRTKKMLQCGKPSILARKSTGYQFFEINSVAVVPGASKTKILGKLDLINCLYEASHDWTNPSGGLVDRPPELRVDAQRRSGNVT